MYKLLPSHLDDPTLSAMEAIAATNWKNFAISSLKKFFRNRFDSVETAYDEMKSMMNRVLQKQDYNTVCLNDSVKTLAENDQIIA